MKKTIIFAMMVLLGVQLISAAGVATSYWNDNPLKLAPGESAIVSLRLQSSESETVVFRATLNNEIAKLVEGPNYEVPVGATDIPVSINISIPQNAKVGTKYNIQISFQQISSGGEGMLQVAQGITSKLPVEVISEADKVSTGQPAFLQANLAWIVLVGVCLIIGVIALLRKKKVKRLKH